MTVRLLCVVGTRPEAIKMAPVIFAANADERFRVRTVTTGQHREILRDVFASFGIAPHRDLELMRPGQSLADITSRGIAEIDALLGEERPDLVLAQGDTTTVMATALTCFYRRLPFGHVEAGLRTGNRWLPFPEEVNRIIAGRLADIHFAPTETARAALRAEGVPDDDIVTTGNTVIDALLHLAGQNPRSPVALPPGARLLLLTAHRRESFGAPLREALAAVRQLVDVNRDLEVLYPVHPNPEVRAAAAGVLAGHPRIHLTAPLEYRAFVGAMRAATLVLTDSGGVQEEAPALGKPVLVLRDETERPEAVSAGVVRLVGLRQDVIVAEAQRLLDDPAHYASMATGVSPYGDGLAAGRIVAALAQRYDGGK